MTTFIYDKDKKHYELWEIANYFQRRNFIQTNNDLTTRYTIWNQIFSFPIPWCVMHAIILPNFIKYRSIDTKSKSRFILISHLPVMLFINTIFIFAGIACFVFYHGCDPISTKQIANKNQIATLWLIESLQNKIPSLGGIILSVIISNAISQYSVGISFVTDTLMNQIIFQSLKKVKENEFYSKLLKIFIATLLGVSSIVYSISLINIKDSLLALFYVFNNSINSPILGLFLLSMFNPFANYFGALVAFVLNLIINIWLSSGTLVFSHLKSQELKTNTFKCDAYNITTRLINSTIDDSSYYPNDPSLYYLYSISFMWYCLFSAFFMILIGSLLSAIYLKLRRYSSDSTEMIELNERKKYLYKARNSSFINSKSVAPVIESQ